MEWRKAGISIFDIEEAVSKFILLKSDQVDDDDVYEIKIEGAEEKTSANQLFGIISLVKKQDGNYTLLNSFRNPQAEQLEGDDLLELQKQLGENDEQADHLFYWMDTYLGKDDPAERKIIADQYFENKLGY